MDELQYEKLTDFYIADLTDLSDKMEKTDEKMQFFLQLYFTIIAAAVTLLGKDLVVEKQYVLSSMFWLALAVMGYFVLRYYVAGMSLHYHYVNRMNKIRYTILRHLGKSHDDAVGYGYTSPNRHNTTGMTYKMVYFLEVCIAAFVGAFVLFAFFACKIFSCVEGAVACSVVIMLVTLYLLHVMNKKTTHELTAKGNEEIQAFNQLT